MEMIVSSVARYFILAITAVTVENAVLARGLGISRLISLIDYTTDTKVFAILLTSSMTLSGVIFWFACRFLPEPYASGYMYIALTAVLCMAISFAVVFVLAIKLMPVNMVAKAAAAMPGACFNSMVLGTLFLTVQNTMTLLETVIFCVFSSLGFILAVLLVTEGQQKLQNREMPTAFKGLPATLLYLSGLSMAVYALVGHVFSL